METLNSPTLLIAPEQLELWNKLNDTAADVAATTLGALFLQRVREQPDALAVVAARRTLTYREVAGYARTVAAHLRDATGAVAICVEPGWEQAAAVTGALLAGVPFHAVDPALVQPARWRRLAETATEVVLTQSWLVERLRWPESARAVAVDTLAATDSEEPLPGTVGPDTVACLLTGDQAASRPLPVTHDALVNTVTDLARRFDLGGGDRLLSVSPLGDEVGMSGILMMLLTGGGLVVPDDIDLRTPAKWVTLVNRERVTVWHSPPALAALLVEHLQGRGDDAPRSLRLALLGGEPLALPLVDRLRGLVGPQLRVVNLCLCGPAGLWASCLEVTETDARRGHVPIGAPLANKHLYVLSDAGTLCPVWVTGRLHVGARGLPAVGWGDNGAVDAFELTGELLYRTDLTARLLPDGAVEVVGEDTSRLSVHGHPLNLRDVEGMLATHPAVLSAAVVPAGEGSTAYVKSAPGAQVTGAELLDYLRKKMSPYLLPARIDPVAALPLTASGRVDRGALTAMANPAVADDDASPASASAPPSALVERACALAARVLGVSDVEPNMNLLDLGASSIQLVRLAVQAEQELGIQVEVDQLLAFPSVTVLVSFATTDDSRPQDGVAASPRTDGLILDPVDRAAFKDRQPGIRRDVEDAVGVPLVAPTGDRQRLIRRRTHRVFRTAPAPAAALASLLACVRRLESGQAGPKYAYPSAGSLYPVQVYLTVAPDRVDGVPAGSYYYHPGQHRLVSLSPGAAVDASAHAWINRDAFRSSAFSVYLVADYEAITPMYGDRSRDYCLVEAGAMAQLLMTTAVDVGLGLCPVGELDVSELRGALRLGDRHEMLHTLLGGPVVGGDTGPAARLAQDDMLRRVAQLPPDALAPGTPR